MRHVFFVLACVAISLPACSRNETSAPSKKATAEKHDHGPNGEHTHAEKPAAKKVAAEKPAAPAGVKTATATAKTASADGGQTVEVACASCIYKMKGVEECATAAKIDGKPVLVTGKSPSAHEIGLCKAPKQATLVGEMKGDKFVATKFTIK